MPTTDAPLLQTADSELVRRAAAGETTAFEELYRRHSQAAWRVAQAVTHNAHDAADAVSEAFTRVFQALPTGRLERGGAQFRAYLMTATRNAAIDTLRRQAKTKPSDTLGIDTPEAKSGPTERMVEALDASLVAKAFATLPERWRTILWLTEVEGMAPREAAVVLDLTPNGAAQLAVRAREGLRERYLQVHLADGVSAACNATVPLLGAYVAGGLGARDTARVDQHLTDCAECRERVAELEDLQTSLRRIALPFPLLLAGLASGGALLTKLGIGAAATEAAAHGALAAGGASNAGVIGRAISNPTETLEAWRKPLAGTSVALFAFGVIAAGIIQPERRVETSQGQRPSVVQALPSPAAVGDAINETRTLDSAIADALRQRDERSQQNTNTEPTRPQPAPAPSGTTAPGPRPPAPAPRPVANADVRLGSGSQTLALAAGAGDGSCSGVQISTTVVGCKPAEQQQGKNITVSTRGSVPGDRTVSPV